jgi:ferric-chelate reductase [NAD(P)H]
MNLQALQKISYGMYVIGSKNNEGKINAFLGNTCVQITSDPASLAISINKNNLTNIFINESKVFSVSVVTEEADMFFVGHFGFRTGKDFDKFSKIEKHYEYKIGKTGSPIILEKTNAFFEVEVKNIIDMGTHEIFIGNILESEILNNNQSMSYKFYHETLKGKTAKNAPTYIKS